MIATGGLSGGISVHVSGGSFWAGVRQGVISSGLNHAMHMRGRSGGGPDDPLEKHRDKAISLKEWVNEYKNKTYWEIITERGWIQGQPAGPSKRYVINPIDGKVMDMRHVTVVRYGYGRTSGKLIEHIQYALRQYGSAYDLQDYYSNNIGHTFHLTRSFHMLSSDSWAADFKRFIRTDYKELIPYLYKKQ